jgi:RNA polymerase sigma-70 factor (ECF subfamily)
MSISNKNINLIKACLEGQRKAQRALFEQHTAFLFAICLRYMNQRQEAEEVLQDSWIAIFKGLGNYKEEGNFRAWMKTIVIRKAWKAIREKSHHIDLDTIPQPVSYSLDDNIIDKLTCEEILNLLADIPVGSREVFKMYVIEGFSHVEIGKILNIAASTSRVQLTKARRLIKEKFNSLNQISHEGIRAV